MKSKIKSHLCLFAATAALMAAAAPARAQWTEKYPVTPITEPNVVTAYLRANFGKIGEIAAKRIEKFLNDPMEQAKMAAKAVQYLEKLSRDSNRSEDDRARELVAKIDAEIAALKGQGYVSAATGPLATWAAFSPTYNVVKLTWQADRPPSFRCQFTGRFNDIIFADVLQEADYRIYRNGRLIATLAGQNNGAGSKAQSVDYTSNGFAFTFTYSWPVKPQPGEVVFYDYDPYQGQLGTPLNYRIEAQRQGCGAFANANGPLHIGANLFRTELTVDGDGNSIPDFIPESVVRDLRAAPADPTPPAGGLPGSGNYSLMGGLDCACAGNPNIAKADGWRSFVRALDDDLVAKTGSNSSAFPQIAAALTQCYATDGVCTAGSVTIQRDYSIPSKNGFRHVWILRN
jgi:hypothetical protein